jgi:hypothetical protein
MEVGRIIEVLKNSLLNFLFSGNPRPGGNLRPFFDAFPRGKAHDGFRCASTHPTPEPAIGAPALSLSRMIALTAGHARMPAM